jgi:hypothetical protein
MQPEKPYVAPLIRRLMPNATEEEIVQASENLRAYLNVLYDIFLEREAKQRAYDSQPESGYGRFKKRGALPPHI